MGSPRRTSRRSPAIVRPSLFEQGDCLNRPRTEIDSPDDVARRYELPVSEQEGGDYRERDSQVGGPTSQELERMAKPMQQDTLSGADSDG
jgi:hypothetical protein